MYSTAPGSLTPPSSLLHFHTAVQVNKYILSNTSDAGDKVYSGLCIAGLTNSISCILSVSNGLNFTLNVYSFAGILYPASLEG